MAKNPHIPRYIDRWLDQYVPRLKAIVIEGPKGVGKTQSAKLHANTVFELDKERVRETLDADYNVLWEDEHPILLDEWQRLPETWDTVRRMVDEGIDEGAFILTGSKQSTNPLIHSGAGRIVPVRMRPLSLAERFALPQMVELSDCLSGRIGTRIRIDSPITFPQYIHEIVRTGLPEIYHSDDDIRAALLLSYIKNITDREFRLQGILVRQPEVLRNWMRSYAAAVGTTASYNKILDAATGGQDQKPARQTTESYRAALESLWLIDDLPYWSEGEDFFGRLKQAPKHYLADPGLEAYLLDLEEQDLTRGTKETGYDIQYGSITGRLFESLCAMSLRTYAELCGARVSYLRSHDGAREIDFIVQKGQSLLAIECKIGSTVSDSDVRHLNWFEEKVGDRVKEKIVLTTGERAYRRKDRVLVIPAALFG